MITAAEARTRSNKILYPVSETPEFKTIMSKLDADIRKAVEDGRESIEVISYCLAVLNNYKYPEFINRKEIDTNHFWWPFVKDELQKNGFTIRSTMTCDHYIVAW